MPALGDPVPGTCHSPDAAGSRPHPTSTMSKRACLACRYRKVKCFPGSPRCARCTALGIEECVYASRAKGRGPDTLRTGEACTSCRRKKRRCDGQRPCTTCAKAGGGAGCIYEEVRTAHNVIRLPHTTRVSLSLDGAAPGPSNAGLFSQWSLGGTEETAEPSKTPGPQIDHPQAQFDTDPPVSPFPDPAELLTIPEVSSMPHTFREPGSIGVVGDTTYEVLSGPRHPENPGNVAMSSASCRLSARTLPSQTFSEPPIGTPDGPLLTWNFGESNSTLPSSTALCERPPALVVQPPWDGPSSSIRGEIVPGPSSDVPIVQPGMHTTPEPAPHHTVSSFTILPSVHFRTIPRSLPTPISLVPPERVQVSCVAESEFDMIYRLRSLCRMNKLGLYFTTEKQQALLRGDTSDVVVNRYFVYSFQAIGMRFCEVPDDSSIMVRLQARYAQLAWESIVEISKTGNLTLRAQGLLHLVCGIIDGGDLRFMPVYGRPPQLSDQVREDAAVLSQAIYLENYFYLTLGGSAPAMTARIEREFRLEFQRVYPVLFDICPLTMRTQSILLIRDATLLLNLRSAEDVEHWTNVQRESCHQLVLALDRFSNSLMGNLLRFIEMGDNSGTETIWTCCVACLAHLVALCHFVSQTEPTLRGPMDDLFDLALAKLGGLSHEVPVEEYSYFDVLTGISWKRALDTIDARIGLRSHTDNGSLWYRREVVKWAYDGLQANLLGCGPSPLISLALSVDGRTPDSGYPNLLLHTERERYGL